MSDIEWGTVVAIDLDRSGSTLTVAALIGDDQLQVVNVVDFTGGDQLQLAGVIYGYTIPDDDGTVLELTTPVTAAADIADRVEVWDSSTGADEAEPTIDVDLDNPDGGDPITAIVPIELRDVVGDILDIGAAVGVVEEEPYWRLVALGGQQRQYNASTMLKPDTIPVAADGVAPAAPTLTAYSGKGEVILAVTPPGSNADGGPQADAVRYRFYASTDSAVLVAGAAAPVDPALFVAEGAQTLVGLTQWADGTAFPYEDASGNPQPIWFAATAVDNDGESVLSAMVSASKGKIDASAEIIAGSITSGLFRSVMAVVGMLTARGLDADGNPTGQGPDFGADGLFGYGADGTARFSMPTDPTLPFEFRGNVYADYFEALSVAVVQTLSLMQGGVLTLQTGVQPPASPPTTSIGYATRQFTDDGHWGDRRGWSSNGTYWYTARKGGTHTLVVEQWNRNGTLAMSQNLSLGGTSLTTVHGSTIGANGNLWVFYEITYDIVPGTSVTDHRILEVGATTLNAVKSADWLNETSAHSPEISGRTIALGYDSVAGDFLIAQSRSGNGDKVRILRYKVVYNATDDVWEPSFVSSLDTTYAYAFNLSHILYGSFDLGASRYIFGAFTTSGNAQVINTSGVLQTTEQWPLSVAAGLQGMDYAAKTVTGVTVTSGSPNLTGVSDTFGVSPGVTVTGAGIPAGATVKSVTGSTVVMSANATSSSTASVTFGPTFRAVSASGLAQVFEGGGNKWTTSTDATWYAGMVYTNGATKTSVGPRPSFTMTKRARLTVSIAGLPSGVTGAELYLAKGSTAPNPAVASMKSQGAMAGTPPMLVVAAADFGTADNPTSNGFGSGTPAKITTPSGITYLAADDTFSAPKVIQRGSTSITPSAADTTTTVAVTFATPMATTPTIMVSVRTGPPTSGSTTSIAWATSPTNTGFNLNYRRGNTTTTTIDWVANCT